MKLIRPSITDKFNLNDHWLKNLDILEEFEKNGTVAKATALTREGEDGKKLEGLSNENIIINGDFRNVINQNGQIKYTSNQSFVYTVDCVRISTGVLTVGVGYINFTAIEGSNYSRISSPVENILHSGETYTVSALIKVNTKSSGESSLRVSGANQTLIPMSDLPLSTTSNFKLFQKTFTVTQDYKNPAIEIMCNGGLDEIINVDIAIWKLEKGKISTLLSDPPQNYGIELKKCQWYQTVFGGASCRVRSAFISPSFIDFVIPITSKLRISPTIVGDLAVYDMNNINIKVEGFSFSASPTGNTFTPGMLVVRATKSNHGLTDAYLMSDPADSLVIFNANL